MTFDGFVRRIDEWVERAKNGFGPEDFALDAHLFFAKTRRGAIATVDLNSRRLTTQPGETGVVSASWTKDETVLEIVLGDAGNIKGRSYNVGDVRVPLRNLDAVRELLTTNQKRNFDRRLGGIIKRGESKLFLVAWDRELGRETLVLLAALHDEGVVTEAIEVAPNDTSTLKLRAGPDVDLLVDKRVAVFGVGAVGSNVALRLAEAGLGELVLIDRGRLRPGDVVRHAAGSWQVGQTKISAVRFLASARAPWTKVETFEESSWHPDRLDVFIEGSDCVIDATGLSSFANMMSLMCADRSIVFASAALYRGGAVGRVRRQGLPKDALISERAENSRYPVIPAGDEPFVFEPGCSSPVNEASPIAVASIAATTADIVLDSLSGRNLHSEETIDVCRPLEAAPFDRLGRLEVP